MFSWRGQAHWPTASWTHRNDRFTLKADKVRHLPRWRLRETKIEVRLGDVEEEIFGQARRKTYIDRRWARGASNESFSAGRRGRTL
jgi:hypothetical protein